MNYNFKNRQIKEIKLTPTESETKPEGIAYQLTFTGKSASEIPEPLNGVSFTCNRFGQNRKQIEASKSKTIHGTEVTRNIIDTAEPLDSIRSLIIY